MPSALSCQKASIHVVAVLRFQRTGELKAYAKTQKIAKTKHRNILKGRDGWTVLLAQLAGIYYIIEGSSALPFSKVVGQEQTS